MSEDGKPSFGELRDALMPPGTDKNALWSALKNAQVTGGHMPGRTAPDISMGPVVTDLSGKGVHPVVAKALAGGASSLEEVAGALAASQQERISGPPADPLSPGTVAGIGLAEMYNDMLAGGIPLASVERILGAMLAAYGIMDKDGS